ncbi:alpha/beta hydrolase [Lysinibacillus sp. 54212]|uniref:alpha/beta hydrolase n=1 Tax=Lysinibacillus sp. 54212 TaxID=3119829 RepID=UPI002FC59E86
MTANFIGKWQGDIEIPQAALSIIIDLHEITGTLSVPIQGLIDYPFQSVHYNKDTMTVEVNLNGSPIRITGKLEGNKITGTFTQNGQSYPIAFSKHVPEEITYEEISIAVEGGNLKAALQLTEEKHAPIAIIIAGSGPTTKDGNTMGMGENNSLKMLAEGLAMQGIASVRFDKRGIAENASLVSSEEEFTIDQYVKDVEQLIKFAKEDNRFTAVHIIGHSEGSLIGMMAAKNEEVDSFISLAGAGRAADVILLEQLQDQLTPELLSKTEQILSSLKAGKEVREVPTELQALFRPSVQQYMISWLKQHPTSLIKQLSMPVLVVQGTTDLQVNYVDAEALKAANETAKLVYIDGMNHVLKSAPVDREANIATYSNPTLPLADTLVETITEFFEN